VPGCEPTQQAGLPTNLIFLGRFVADDWMIAKYRS